jgi:hypothetical protein
MQGDADAAFANAAARMRSESPTPDWTISDMSSGMKLTPCERGWGVRLVTHDDRCQVKVIAGQPQSLTRRWRNVGRRRKRGRVQKVKRGFDG